MQRAVCFAEFTEVTDGALDMQGNIICLQCSAQKGRHLTLCGVLMYRYSAPFDSVKVCPQLV